MNQTSITYSESHRKLAWLEPTFVVACLVTLLPGVWAIAVRFTEGLQATALGSMVPWGLWVAFYIYYIGLSAGSFLISTLVTVFGVKRFEPMARLAVWQALVALLIGIFFIFMDLGHPERFWHVFRYPQWNSVLAWEIQIYNFYIVLLLAELYLLMRPDLVVLGQKKSGLPRLFYHFATLGYSDLSTSSLLRDRKWIKALGILGIPIAVGVHGGTGAIFAVVKAHPYWYSPLFPIVFIVSALASGGALLLFLQVYFCLKGHCSVEDKQMLVSLARLVAGFLILDLSLLFIEFLVGFYGEVPEHMATYATIARGPFWWVFWIVQLLLGAVVPLSLIFHQKTKNSCLWLGFAGLLVFLGIFGVRLNIIIPPLTQEPLPGYIGAYHSWRISSFYFPNLIEWLTSLGTVALGCLLFYIGLKVLPIETKEAEGGT
ncbi:MAG: polysulfide reductase NrfD [Candidatus Omnitrophica bacterium]|nr:polysulfide reductase NrfD [Candidatus Omnitrophota bacterium]